MRSLVKNSSDRIEELEAALDAANRDNADLQGQVDAIAKSQAVIEFNMDGTIVTANANFLGAMGYSLDEIKGRHHSMFADPDYAASAEYKAFWEKLNRGEYDTGEYLRYGKNQREVWIQASYNPVIDDNGRPVRVIKYAADITAQKELHKVIERVLGETSRVMMAVASGDLSDRVSGSYSGEFADLQQAVNGSLDVIATDVIEQAVDVMGAMATGDLSRRITGDLDGRFAELQAAVNGSLDNLSSTVAEINRVAEAVDTGSGEISQGNTNLSQRTEEQASSLEETASSMEEMTSTVKQNADNASEANQLAIAARDQAEKGGAVVREAIVAMEEINASSKKISDIIGVIDEIAFQTNLLALNASVEAARAGDQGRGFAVVASEVRNLAGRSATAAKEIKELILDSSSKVEQGSRLVNQSGETLGVIVDGVKKVTDIVGEIAAASIEQSQGIDQVNTAITQMDELTQQNAALVEEAAAASESLSEQAQGLAELMSHFDAGGASAGAAPAVERRSAARPWSQPAAAPVATPRAAAANGSDQDWQEF